jgi:hypothetical protein
MMRYTSDFCKKFAVHYDSLVQNNTHKKALNELVKQYGLTRLQIEYILSTRPEAQIKKIPIKEKDYFLGNLWQSVKNLLYLNR